MRRFEHEVRERCGAMTDSGTLDGAACRPRVIMLLALSIMKTAAPTPMLYSATPALLPANSGMSEISLSGTRLDGCHLVALRHFELGLVANVSGLRPTSSAVTFGFPENWPEGFVQVQAVSDSTSSNLLGVTLYNEPNITAIVPNRTSVAGGSMLTLTGSGMFQSTVILVRITTGHVSQLAAGLFIDDDTVKIQMPQFPIPTSIDQAALGPGEEHLINATVELSMNGFDFSRGRSIVLSIVVSAKLKIGYLFVGSVSDHGWCVVCLMSRLPNMYQ